MKLKEVNQAYHFDKQRLKTWLINNDIIPKDFNEDIYTIECDTELIMKIDQEKYTITHTPIRAKFRKVDDYTPPHLIPMTFTVLNIDNFVVLDTETTGLYKDDEVIELSIIDKLGNELYHSLFKPEKKVGKAALRVTGLDNPLLANEPLFKDEWSKIKKAIGHHRILGHNITYDERITLATAKRYGIDEMEVRKLFDNKIDSRDIARKYLKSRSYKLSYLCKKLGINEKQKHRATYDCLQTLEMLRALETRLLNSDYSKDIIVYDEDRIRSEQAMEKDVEKAIIYGYKAHKSIEDLSIFYGVSRKDITTLIITAYQKGECSIYVNPQTEEKVLFILRSMKEPDVETMIQKCQKYAKDYEVRLILAKKGIV